MNKRGSVCCYGMGMSIPSQAFCGFRTALAGRLLRALPGYPQVRDRLGKERAQDTISPIHSPLQSVQKRQCQAKLAMKDTGTKERLKAQDLQKVSDGRAARDREGHTHTHVQTCTPTRAVLRAHSMYSHTLSQVWMYTRAHPGTCTPARSHTPSSYAELWPGR